MAVVALCEELTAELDLFLPSFDSSFELYWLPFEQRDR
jgi:hypothetical protein